MEQKEPTGSQGVMESTASPGRKGSLEMTARQARQAFPAQQVHLAVSGLEGPKETPGPKAKTEPKANLDKRSITV